MAPNWKFWQRRRSPPTPRPNDLVRLDVSRNDGWLSALTGFGTTKDKRTSVSPNFKSALSDQEVEILWRSDDIASRIIETVPTEAFREGYTLNLEDKQLSVDFVQRLTDLEVVPKMLETAKYERGYGGGAIFPIMNDMGADLTEPLNEDRIIEIKHLITFEPRELVPQSWYTDLSNPNFGKPEIYALNPRLHGGGGGATPIHESRLIPFPGHRVSRRQQSPVHEGWGDSIMFKVYEVLRDFGISWDATAVLLHEFSQASFKIKGLAELMANDNDQVVKNRIRATELSRSTINAVLMDSEEQFERTQTPVTGLADLLASFATRLAAAAEMPVTKLMGQSPAGLNATGESDIRFWYDSVNSYREMRIRPQFERLIKLIMLSRDSPTRGKEPDTWSFEFNPLWQPSAKEEAETRKIVADTDMIYFQIGLSSEEILTSRLGGDEWSKETILEGPEALPTDDIDITDEEIGDIRTPSIEIAEEITPVEIQKSVMAAGQITSLISIVSQVNDETLTRKQGVAIIMISFQVDEVTANKLLGPEEEETPEVKKPDPVIPFDAPLISESDILSPGGDEEE